MTLPDTHARSFNLPVTHRLRLVTAASLGSALLLAALSLAGLLFQDTVYVTEELRRSFVANDVVNLVLGMPILLGSLWLARRGRLIGLLFWPGALFFVIYNAIAYVYALPAGWSLLIYLVLLALAVYTLIGLMASIDADAVQERLAGKAPERLAGGVLLGLGVLFLLRGIGVIVAAEQPLPHTELAVLVADFLTIPAWIIGGALLWRRQPLGYVAGVGLLFQASMLFVGLIAWMLLTPLMTAAPFVLVDVIVVFVMGLICFIPFGFFVRGVARAQV
jgi:hypothetical protein